MNKKRVVTPTKTIAVTDRPTLPLRSIKIGSRIRHDMGDVRALADSIERTGLLHPPVVLPDRTLVVGQRRLAALKLLGYTETPVTVVDNIDKLLGILTAQGDENACRKDLTPSEAVALGRRLEPLARKAAKERQGSRTSGKLPRSQSRDDIGAVVGMSGRTYEKAKRVVEAAEAHPETFGSALEEMDRTSRVHRPYNEVRKTLARWEASERARQNPALPDSVNLVHGEFQTEMDALPDDSVALVFVDPPYAKEHVYLYEDLARQAARVLVPGGSLITYIGGSHLFEIGRLVEPHLRFLWPLTVTYESNCGYLIPGLNVVTLSKTLLWFVKGSRRDDTHVEDLVSSGKPDQDFHEWSQSFDEAEYYIRTLSHPNELVVDPMCGAATTLIVAARLGRQCWGCEKDDDRYIVARGRLSLALDSGEPRLAA